MNETAEAIEARMKVYEFIGNASGYAVIGGLCGMAACAIWQAPQWLWNTSATGAAVGGILLPFMLMNYSGARALLKEAEARPTPINQQGEGKT